MSYVSGNSSEPVGNESELRVFPTGAKRSRDADEERYALISPVGLRRLARTYAEGEKKYGTYNWEKGLSIQSVLDHAIRHIYLYLDGDRSEDHLAHAAWNLFAAMHSEERWPELNTDLRPLQHDPEPLREAPF